MIKKCSNLLPNDINKKLDKTNCEQLTLNNDTLISSPHVINEKQQTTNNDTLMSNTHVIKEPHVTNEHENEITAHQVINNDLSTLISCENVSLSSSNPSNYSFDFSNLLINDETSMKVQTSLTSNLKQLKIVNNTVDPKTNKGETSVIREI